VLEQYWGNPPDDSVLGLLVPDQAALAPIIPGQWW
jgi:hypothetical protein